MHDLILMLMSFFGYYHLSSIQPQGFLLKTQNILKTSQDSDQSVVVFIPWSGLSQETSTKTTVQNTNPLAQCVTDQAF